MNEDYHHPQQQDDVREQAKLSGLAFLGSSSSSQQQQSQPHWQTDPNQWPPLVGGWRYGHASVVVKAPYNPQHDKLVVVMGGHQVNDYATNTVILLPCWQTSTRHEWKQGPNMTVPRRELAAVVCRDHVYVLGGISHGFVTWDTIERISIADLIMWATIITTTTTTTALPTDPNKFAASKKTATWETLQCRLMEARYGCAATTVQDRYIVVVGGRQKSGGLVSSVEVLDTAAERVFQGPPLTVRRLQLGLAVVGSRLYAVGGRRSLAPTNDSLLQSIEYWDFDDHKFGFKKAATKTTTSNPRRLIHPQLQMRIPPPTVGGSTQPWP